MFRASPTFDAVAAAGAPAGVALTILLESVLEASPLPLHAPRPAAITMRYRRIDTLQKFETFSRLPTTDSRRERRYDTPIGINPEALPFPWRGSLCRRTRCSP